MSNPKVFIFAPTNREPETYGVLTDAGCELLYGKASWTTPQGDKEDDVCSITEDCDAFTGTSIRSTPITGKMMKSAPKLRIVSKCVIGVDDVDVEAATEQGILVTHSPIESNWSAVAEGTLAIMLTILKKTREKDEAMKRGEWRDMSLFGTYLGKRHDGYPGLTIGIVGLGRIGRRLADLLAPWRVRILAYDPYVDDEWFIISNVKRVDLPTLLRESDLVTLHVILTNETRNMIGVNELAMMKQGAILINTSRGQVVNETALAEALRSGKLSAAGLDCFENEPLAAGSPLLALGHKVLLSPHMIASNLGTGQIRQGVVWANTAVLAALKGEVPANRVFNKEVIPRWLARFGGRSCFD
jgi:phosphoglycerate dehydrogenase-like enzyme